MRRHHITWGALTTAGGVVVSAGSNGTIEGKPIALEGDKITCRSCKSVGYIICVGPRIPESWQDKQVALENDLCVCKCTPHPRLLPNQSLRFQTVEGTGASMQSASVRSAPLTTQDELFNERFQLLDGETGNPLADVEYAIVRESGEIEHGRTDEEGHTHILSSTAESEHVEIYA